MGDKLKVAFIHPEIRTYRVGVLNRLADEYSFSFLIAYDKSEVALYPDSVKWGVKTFSFFIRIPGTNRSFPPGVFKKILLGDYDVVIASDSTTVETMLAFAAAKLSGKKFILWNELWDYPDIPRFRLIKPLLKFMTRKADALIAAGSQAHELYIAWGADEEKVFIAPNCALDYRDKRTEDLRERFGVSGRKVVLYLGRLVAYKGLDFLLRAFAELEKRRDDVFLVVGGSGPFEGDCRSLARRLRIRNIKFVGYVTDVASYYRMCDVFVLPSRFIRDSVPSEAWGLALNEVMSLGKPVVSTDAVAGAYDLIEDGVNGFMVENGNSDALLNALERILSDDELRKSMGGNSRRIIDERFTFERMFLGFKEAIEYSMRKK
jgi:glycosyltransferase involved in cell wall biosynthesis